MKKYILLCAVLSAMMIMTPLFSVKYSNEALEKILKENKAKDEYISVMRSETGETSDMKIREYLIGCVAGEMDARFHEEALKAQAVASYTFAQYIKNRDKDKPGADISDDSSVYQSYIDEEKRKDKWKDSFEKYESAVENAVDAVLGQQILYDDKPIMAVYFDKCNGMTESSENIWGKKLPYLVSVTSDGDKLSPELESYEEFTIDEFKNAFSKKNIDFSSEKALIGDVKRYDSGVVKSINISGCEMAGTEFRAILGLKSADFTIGNDENKVKITCQGNGHFVGMSQYGADYMARQGSDYKEILQHYFPNTEIR
ncbi:MAG: stage II sporulation protein D [Clostridia bacterium]|nr:stage II sporulation protein D [Clostridia bacterium]